MPFFASSELATQRLPLYAAYSNILSRAVRDWAHVGSQGIGEGSSADVMIG